MPAQAANARARPKVQNSPNVSVVDLQHVVRTWTDKQASLGKVSQAKVDAFWQENGSNYLEKLKSWFPIAKDIKEATGTVRLIASELGILGRYYIKNYRGRAHIVFKGHNAARQFLTKKKYSPKHNKIVSLKMTTRGMKVAARDGAVFGILFCTVIDVVDYFTNDRATLGSLFGAVGMDIAKTLIGTGAAFAAGVATAAFFGTAVVAIGPVIAAVAVGVTVSIALDMIDNHFGLTKKLGALCDRALARLKELPGEVAEQASSTWRQIENSAVVRDLSREAGEWGDWIAERASKVSWQRSFL